MTYSSEVLADAPTLYWRLNEASGSAVTDSAGTDAPTAGTGVTRGAAGPLIGSSSTASTFDGTANGLIASTVLITAPNTFTIEAWFKTTTTGGGKIVGYGGSRTGLSSTYDRHVYMDAAGKINFGVFSGGQKTLTSAAAYNDGAWHHVVATMSLSGMYLYLDGKRDAFRGDVHTGDTPSGYWRVGGDNSWSGNPWFPGQIAEVAIWKSATLSAQRVDAHYVASGRATRIKPPATDSYGALVFASNPDVYYRLDETSGTTAVDAVGIQDATISGNVTLGVPGKTGRTAMRFGPAGTLARGAIVPLASNLNPGAYSLTIEAWFKTSTTKGGRIVGLGDAAAGASSSNVFDRLIWMQDNGTLVWGVYNGGQRKATSTAAFNDGKWHHVVATLGPAGMVLYVDGQSVATNTNISAADAAGYWRIGGDATWGGNTDPTLAGDIAEVAIYPTVLSPTTIANHYSSAGVDGVDGSLAASVASPSATLSGTVLPPPVTGTLAATLQAPTAALSGTVTNPVTGTLAATLPSPTATLSGAATPPAGIVAGTLAATLSSLTGSLAGTVINPADSDPDALSGTGGAFTIDFGATSSHTVTFTPAFAGSLVMQAANGWQATYTVLDDDGDDVQDDIGALGLIWDAGETMTITIAPVAGQPLVPVTFQWSYAARASSPLSISLDNDEVLETPGGLGIDIYNGQPGDSVTLSVLGPTAVADFQTVHLDTFGVREDLMVRLPALDAGAYFLRVEGDTSGSEDTPFTVLDDALFQGETTPRGDDTAPPRDPALHWRLFDLRDHDVNYTFVRNPSSWTNVYPPNDFTHDKTTAPDGQPLTWQAAARPWRMEFTGWLDTETEYNDLLFWSQLRRRLWLIDHRNRAWLITIEQFDAQAQVTPNLPWAHKYTVKTLVFMQG